MICQYIDSHKKEFGVEPICKVLTGAGVKIAPSTYYAAKTRSPSARSLRDETLKAEISKVHKDNYSVLGARKIHVMLNRPEIAERHGAGHVARCTVERLMGDLGLRGVRRAKSPRTTRSAPKEQCPADLVKRHFNAFRPNELWVADIPPQAGGAPLLCTRLLRVGLCGFRDRRVLPEDHRLADHLSASVHRPGPGRPENGRLATKANRC